MEETLKHKAVKGVLWRILEVGAGQGISLVLSIILARLIMPDQFGLIAMLGIFFGITNVFVDSGFAQALIRKNNRTQIECSTVYWYNIGLSFILYILLFLCAPFISYFYNEPLLTPLLRFTAIRIIIASFTGVHRTLLKAEMKFKLMTKFNLLSSFISGVVGITLAYLDFKVWALAWQDVIGACLSTIFLLNKVKWRPSLVFSLTSLKEFFGFGSKLLASSILDIVYSNITPIIIGKVYRASDLAYYNRAYSLAGFTSSMPCGVLQSITYPTLCKIQDNESLLKDGYRRMIKLSAFIIFPMCIGMGAVAYPLINVVYSSVWIFAATLLSIVVFSMMWYPIHAINLNYLIVKGKSNLFFRLEIIKKIQGLAILMITVPLGLEAMCWGGVAGSLLSLIWNTYYTGKFLKMGILSQLRDIFPTILLCAVMYAISRTIANIMGNDIISLVCSIAAGIVIFVGGAFLFRFPEIRELKNLKK